VAALSARQGSAKFRKVYPPTAFLPPAYSKSKKEETRMSELQFMPVSAPTNKTMTIN
jgi:hypothetical protein